MSEYRAELERLAGTYEYALRCDVQNLKNAIVGASESSVIGVGSGGSYTAAALLCDLHEFYTGRVSRPSTPLEIISNPTLASSSPVFLFSAEGKNPDITEALIRARRHSARTIHVVTNRENSPLMAQVGALSDVSAHVYELSEKDGYLATNSLLLDALLLARTYGELDNKDQVPPSIAELHLGAGPIGNWLTAASHFIDEVARRGALIVVYSPQLRSIAADLESKLSEAALLYCQLADFRAFAHGRHLWLADRSKDIAVLALTEPTLNPLWQEMQALVPANVPTLTMPLSGAAPRDLIAGLVCQMHFVNAVAERLNKDVGKPVVPQFGRDLYYLDLPRIVPRPEDTVGLPERSKYEVLGAKWPSAQNHGAMARARDSFVAALHRQSFRAIVFDYDGTLCHSQRNDAPPPETIFKHIEILVEAGVVVGIASGRGGSIQECLRERFAAEVLNRIELGLYNGGWISDASAAPTQQRETSEFLSHVTRLVHRLQTLGVPIDKVRTTHPFQVSVRFREGLPTEHMWWVIADSLRQDGLTTSTMYRSKHSVDILAPDVSKARLIEQIILKYKLDPYEILTMGDQGAWPGNDSALLEHRFSLSVDMPSRRIDRGWKLAPSHKRDVDATLWYLERIKIETKGQFQMHLPELT
jgi:HAD superfamily hydrolase (TIGR01484 family)